MPLGPLRKLQTLTTPLLATQELQNEPDMAEGSLGSASRGPGGPAERRERATISARIENAVVPELGALAARCSRLVGQASLAFSESPLSHACISESFCLDGLSQASLACSESLLSHGKCWVECKTTLQAATGNANSSFPPVSPHAIMRIMRYIIACEHDIAFYFWASRMR